jgi:hypothetical protein
MERSIRIILFHNVMDRMPSYEGKSTKIRLLLYTCRQSPHEFDLWERDQSTILQVGDKFHSFIESNPVLLGEREISLSLWLEEVQ